MATGSKKKRGVVPPRVPWQIFLKMAVLLALGWWALAPMLSGSLGGDDALYLTNNPLRHDPEQWWKIWFAPGSFIEYYPITATVEMMQWQMWHEAPLGYLLTNLVLHLVNALLVWRLLHQLGLRQGWLGGLLFAVHPTVVESVGWISELKNTLSLTPFLLAMGAWIRYDAARRGRDYVQALIFYSLAMLCKISMAPFPVVILLYAWWKRSRIDRNDLTVSLPFFVIALVLGMTTQLAGERFAEHFAPSSSNLPAIGLLARIALIGLTGSFYFAKFFWPWTPAPIYPQWSIDPPMLWQGGPWLALAGVFFVCWKMRPSWGRTVLLGLGYFFLMLAPFLGFPEISFMNYTWVMDHFLYLPMIGLIGLTVAGMEKIDLQLSPKFRPWTAFTLALLVGALALETHTYAALYANQEALFTYNLRLNPNSYMVHSSLGDALMQKGDVAGAIARYQEAVALNPRSDSVHFSLGSALMHANRWEEARDQFQEALQLTPNYADACDNLGAVLLQLGHPNEAMAQFRRAMQISDFAQVHNDLGNALLQTGRIDEAIAEYQRAAQLDADVAQVHDNLALAFFQAKRFPEAIRQFQMALTIDPHDELARGALDKLQTGTIR